MPSDRSSPPSSRLNIELLLGLSATFLSFAALTVSIFQTKIAREKQHASVWPYLQTQISTTTNVFRYGIVNKGIGPAIVKEVEWRSGDSTYKQTHEFVLNEIGSGKGLGRSSFAPDAVFSPEGSLSLITVYDNDSLSNIVSAKLDNESFNLRVIYSDVYGNCWELDQGKTRQLATCPE